MGATVILVGNVGGDPESKYTKDGTKIATLRLAVSTRSGGQDQTTWFRLTGWRTHADLLEKYVRKGHKLQVIGDLTVSEYTDKSNVKRTTLEVKIDKMEFLTPKGKSEESAEEDEWA